MQGRLQLQVSALQMDEKAKPGVIYLDLLEAT